MTKFYEVCVVVSLEFNDIIFYYSKTYLKRNLKGPEHFSAEARFPFNKDIL
jgi:hypothetical protein